MYFAESPCSKVVEPGNADFGFAYAKSSSPALILTNRLTERNTGSFFGGTTQLFQALELHLGILQITLFCQIQALASAQRTTCSNCRFFHASLPSFHSSPVGRGSLCESALLLAPLSSREESSTNNLESILYRCVDGKCDDGKISNPSNTRDAPGEPSLLLHHSFFSGTEKFRNFEISKNH